MRIVTNTGDDRVVDALRPRLGTGASISVASPRFSLVTFGALRKQLTNLAACRLILPADGEDLQLFGSEHDRAARNRLQLRWLARSFTQWLAENADLRFAPKALPQGMVVVNGSAGTSNCALVGNCSLSSEGLGLSPSESFGITQFTDEESGVT
ncbi:MAG: helicase, partial [Dehalococcoidia bacterium]|nr:helicase [Dehalococcoidia bacterium]